MNRRYPGPGSCPALITCPSTYAPAWGLAATFPSSCGYGSTGILLPSRVWRNITSRPQSRHLVVLAITGHLLRVDNLDDVAGGVLGVVSDADLLGQLVGVPSPLEPRNHLPGLSPGQVV